MSTFWLAINATSLFQENRDSEGFTLKTTKITQKNAMQKFTIVLLQFSKNLSSYIYNDSEVFVLL